MDNPPEPYDPENHSAWLASLSPDESLVIHTPSGYQLIFIMVALTKRALLTKDIKPAEQLLLLEKMNSLTDQYFTPEMLATIEPMGDIEYEIFKVARSLDLPGDKTGRPSFDVLTSPRVFWHFVALNPSIASDMRRLTKIMPEVRMMFPGAPCPLYPQKQTLVERSAMSALCQKQTSALPVRTRQLTRPPNCLVIRVCNQGAHILQNAMTMHVKKCQVTLTVRSTVVSSGRACNSAS